MEQKHTKRKYGKILSKKTFATTTTDSKKEEKKKEIRETEWPVSLNEKRS